jgi:hypothetical protein
LYYTLSFYLFFFFSILMDNPNSMSIFELSAPLETSYRPWESPKPIFAPNYELCPKLVAIGHNQPFSTAEVLSSHQEGNELLATPRESFNLPINSVLDLALQDPIRLEYFYMGLDNIAFGGVFLSLSIREVRVILISGHTPCISLHDELLEVKKESSSQTRRGSFHSHITNILTP